LKKNTLLMLSGGIDSTATLLWMLDNTDDNIEAHHINLINRERRDRAEKIAVYNILNWFEINKRKFKYTESTIDLGTNYVPNDELIYTFIGALKSLGSKSPELYRLAIGRIKLYNKDLAKYREHRHEICENLYNSVASIPRTEGNVYYEPLIDWTKEEVVSYLPEDLLSLCWYCRTPTTDQGKCGTCVSCMAVKRATGQLTLEEIKEYKRWID